MKIKAGMQKYCVELLLATAALVWSTARAADPLGFYVGAEMDRTRLNVDVPSALGIPARLLVYDYPMPERLNDIQTHWTYVVGFRPTPLLGAELKYINFGHENASFVQNELQYGLVAHANALALFGVLYIPQPIHFVDLYGKVGVARVQSGFSGAVNLGNVPGYPQQCSPGVAQYGFCDFAKVRSRTDMGLAYGAGVQVKWTIGWSSIAARLEYERIQQKSVGNPNLMSFGLV